MTNTPYGEGHRVPCTEDIQVAYKAESVNPMPVNERLLSEFMEDVREHGSIERILYGSGDVLTGH